jgi:DUF1365 family protein
MDEMLCLHQMMKMVSLVVWNFFRFKRHDMGVGGKLGVFYSKIRLDPCLV